MIALIISALIIFAFNLFFTRMTEVYEIYEMAKGDEIANLSRKVLKLWQRVIHRSLDDLNITVPQLEVLGAIVTLKAENTSITQIALSQESGIDPMTTSTIIRNLQKKKLISRKESKTDTRARIVELTEGGIDIIVKAATRIKALHDEVTKNGVDQDILKIQLNILLENLNRVNDNMK